MIPTSRNGAVFALTLVLALGLGASEAAADGEQADPHWLPWTGCWEPVVHEDDEAGGPEGHPAEGADAAPADDATLVCFRPDPENDGVLVQGVQNGELVSQEPLVADALERSVERAGCTGTESARWSEDGKRLFMRSELDCGGVPRVQTSILAFDTPHEWVEVESVRAGDAEPEAGVRRFRAVPDQELAARGIPPFEREEDLALATTREAAASPVTAGAVQEAAQHVQTEAVTAFLLERHVTLDLDARTLVALDDAGTPSEVIDLLVALAHPDDFDVDAETAHAQRRTPRTDYAPRKAHGPVPSTHGWIVLAPAPHPLGHRYFSSTYYGPGYTLGPRMPRYRGGHGGIRVTRRESAGTRVGRMVQGLGYIRGDGPPTTSSARDGSSDRPPRRTRGSDGDDSTSSDRPRITPRGATQGGDRGSSGGGGDGDGQRRDRGSSGGGGDANRGRSGGSSGGGDGDRRRRGGGGGNDGGRL